MKSESESGLALNFKIRTIQPEDSQAIVAIDSIYSGENKPDYWQERLKPFFQKINKNNPTLGYVAYYEKQVIGYILAEGRAWEFGSPLCGWIFGIGIQPEYNRHGIALALSRKVCQKFKSLEINTIRTMVRKDNVNMLSFFRASGFRAGPFIELELEI